MRVVADTNIYVSAIVFGGSCEAILALARAHVIDLYLSSAMHGELRSVLGQTFGWPSSRLKEALAEITGLASLVRPTVRLSGIVADDADHRILECALAARADFLVTGDKRHLLPLKTFRGVQIVSPRAFLDLLR